ncbi:outer membrane lipoprotein chaperone LolA [Cysteiniphilum halobium]|uniref:outer membrane lipoprotein chaperone LolA n=1 Tax=Cysteiniphilum halobium TaxID=2219059 RepID=UPI000E656D1E|nr:outer membrane lipoprotein chaperone LolA [Cysteiniphilum halobium]
MSDFKNICQLIKYSVLSVASISALSGALLNPAFAQDKSNTTTVTKTAIKEGNDSESVLFKLLTDLKNMHAKFRQSLINPQQGIKEISTGELWVSKPSFFKWQVESPQKQMLLSNGQKLWNYDEDLEQVTISEVPKNISQAPYLLLLTGDSKILQKLFSMTQNGKHTYRLTPKVNDQSLIKYIDITFAGDTPKSMLIQTEVGQSTHIEFYDISTAKIPTKTYDFTPPKGVDVLG